MNSPPITNQTGKGKKQTVYSIVLNSCTLQSGPNNLFLALSCRERKKDKEREDLWRKLEDLELRRGIQNSDGVIPT